MTTFDVMDADAVECIRCRVRRLVAAGKIRHDESDDISQDALVEYYRRKPKFDARRAGYKTFTSYVVTNALFTLLRGRQRDACRLQSSEALSANEASVTWQRSERIVLDDPQTRIAVHQVLGRLPQKVRQVAHGLSHETPAGLAEAIGTSRTTIYETKKQIRTALQQGGFGPSDCCLRRPEARR